MAIDKTSLKVMNRLFDKGYTTEKAVAAFNLEDITELLDRKGIKIDALS